MPLMPLAKALTAKTNALCAGIEEGTAAIFDLVTPITAELLRWWFLADYCEQRKWNFHAGQKQAILNTIVAHEVLAKENGVVLTLNELYKTVTPETLEQGNLLSELTQAKHQHPKYCLKMATGTGKTWVLQAILVWQVLNANSARNAGIDDPRFTRHFLVVAPGLIVYERLLEAFCGKLHGNERNFASSDVARYAELFIPNEHRETIFGFVQGNACKKEEIGIKTTGNGLLAMTNWHLLADKTEDEEIPTELLTPGVTPTPAKVVADILPLTPGKSVGNSLDMLDRRYARGDVLDYLADLPSLMVFNDEAHHIHEVKKEGEITEVEWQKSLSRIAEKKGQCFVQVDFTATPYNDVGAGRNKRKVYFNHIVVDFDLKQAMNAGLVKSLVLDKRKELGSLPLEYTAERDNDGNAILSEGQRVMLKAGYKKLEILEESFATLDINRHPKMMVMCEDTKITPLVAQFFIDMGLSEEAILVVDSGKKVELGEKEWLPLREKLFDIDNQKKYRIIVSVLMLREGFDVNNICVIVPLRATGAQILLEQTIGRGLRLMWRENEYEEMKSENRSRIKNGQEPASLIDVLSIVEHPAFQSFYDELMQEGLMGVTDDEGVGNNSIGDLISVGLREGYEAFDFAIPFIMREVEENIMHRAPKGLPPFQGMTRQELAERLGKGDVFISQDLQTSTLFGDYRVDGVAMKVGGFNEYISRLTRRIGQALSNPLPKGNKIAQHVANPYMQVNMAELAGWIEDYIRENLFGEPFEPMHNEQWRLLLLQPVLDHIVTTFAKALVENEERPLIGQNDINWRHLSEVDKLPMRESHSLPVNKCIYKRLFYPARNGGFEKAFIEWANRDSSIEAFCKISETRHGFIRLRYVKDDGLSAFYSPDFIVRCQNKVYLVETKAQKDLKNANVLRKQKAAHLWCSRINDLPAADRKNFIWHYVLLGETLFNDYQNKNVNMEELLSSAKIAFSYEARVLF